MQDIIIEFFATFFIWILYSGLLYLWVIDGKVLKEEVIHAIFAGGVAFIIVYAIKHFYPTLRPFMINGEKIDVLIPPSDSAFPSSHTALAFSLAVTIFTHDKKVGWFYLLGALLIGIARVLANVHYPVDILGGAFIGILVAVVIERIHLFNLLKFKFLKRKNAQRI